MAVAERLAMEVAVRRVVYYLLAPSASKRDAFHS
jgi:hypothetical protein